VQAGGLRGVAVSRRRGFGSGVDCESWNSGQNPRILLSNRIFAKGKGAFPSRLSREGRWPNRVSRRAKKYSQPKQFISQKQKTFSLFSAD